MTLQVFYHQNCFLNLFYLAIVKLYYGLKTTGRNLHGELSRERYLRILKDVKIDVFTTFAVQYFNGEILLKKCSDKFTLRIKTWEIFNLLKDELEKLYIKLVSYKHVSIGFFLERLVDLPKIKRLLRIVRRHEKIF